MSASYSRITLYMLHNGSRTMLSRGVVHYVKSDLSSFAIRRLPGRALATYQRIPSSGESTSVWIESSPFHAREDWQLCGFPCEMNLLSARRMDASVSPGTDTALAPGVLWPFSICRRRGRIVDRLS